MKANVWTAGLTLAGIGALATGCAERRIEYVPVYRVQPAYVGQPAYPPPAQPPPNPGAGTAPASPTADWQQPPPAPVPAQPAPSPQTVVVAPSAPPAPQVEVIPVAPGPYYVWAPGYWSWNGGWVWIGGRYMARPRPGAVWVGGHWGDTATVTFGSAAAGGSRLCADTTRAPAACQRSARSGFRITCEMSLPGVRP